MMFYGDNKINRLFHGEDEIKFVMNVGNPIYTRQSGVVWTPSFIPEEEHEFVPDEHHPVDPLFDEYYNWTLYLRVDTQDGDKITFPQGGTEPIYYVGNLYPMCIYDYYNQDWQSHTGLFDDTYRLRLSQTIQYTSSITSKDIEIVNPSGSLLPITSKIEGVANGAWSYSERNGIQSNGNEFLTEIYLGDYTELSEIGNRAFYNSTNLKNIRLPYCLSMISNNAFEGCTSLKIADVRNCSSLLEIKTKAFMGCTSLEKVIISRPTRICYDAFDGCSSLNKIVLLAETPPLVYNLNGDQDHIGKFLNIPEDVVICVPPKSVTLYRNIGQWSNYEIRGYVEDDFTWTYEQ